MTSCKEIIHRGAIMYETFFAPGITYYYRSWYPSIYVRAKKTKDEVFLEILQGEGFNYNCSNILRIFSDVTIDDLKDFSWSEISILEQDCKNVSSPRVKGRGEEYAKIYK